MNFLFALHWSWNLNADVYPRQVLRPCVNALPQFSPVSFIPQLLSEEAGLKLYEARTVVRLCGRGKVVYFCFFFFLKCGLWLASDDVTKLSNTWQRGKLVL